MKRVFLLSFLLLVFTWSNAQASNFLHEGKFKRKIGMSSNHYKPEDWEKPYSDKAIKTAFPSDLTRHPEKYSGQLIHLIGIVDSVYWDNKNDSIIMTFVLENKYWDYIEDYSIQDEVMFVSPKGDGKFLVTLPAMTATETESLKKFPPEKKLFLVYGDFNEISNNLPHLFARQIKYIDYKWYSTKIYSYSVKRDSNGDVILDKNGKTQMTDFSFQKVATRGQNK